MIKKVLTTRQEQLKKLFELERDLDFQAIPEFSNCMFYFIELRPGYTINTEDVFIYMGKTITSLVNEHMSRCVAEISSKKYIDVVTTNPNAYTTNMISGILSEDLLYTLDYQAREIHPYINRMVCASSVTDLVSEIPDECEWDRILFYMDSWKTENMEMCSFSLNEASELLVSYLRNPLEKNVG